VSSLSGKVYLITGASKGMGRAFANALAAQGALVALLARQLAPLEEAVGQIGDAAFARVCDVADPASVDSAVAAVLVRFGRLDGAISNAAITSLLKIESASHLDIQREIAVNLLGPIYLARAAIPHLRAAGGGDLVFISSNSVRMPYPFLTLYGASKGGLEVLAAGLRSELRSQGTRVTVLRSGAVEGTNIEDGWSVDARREFFEECGRTGHAHFTGAPAMRATMAQTLLSFLTLPRDVNVDLLDARGR
jgi:NAD(P)-dependent dehydrogenase (short-subunit alcohol dehydrogenase family)